MVLREHRLFCSYNRRKRELRASIKASNARPGDQGLLAQIESIRVILNDIARQIGAIRLIQVASKEEIDIVAELRNRADWKVRTVMTKFDMIVTKADELVSYADNQHGMRIRLPKHPRFQ